MADTKVSDLPAITTLNNNDILYIGDVSASTSNKITYANLRAPIDNSIAAIDATVDSLSTDVVNLSSEWETYTFDIAAYVTNTTILSSNVTDLSADIYGVEGINAQLEDIFEVIENTVNIGFNGPVTISGTTLTFLSGVLITVT
jgi:hypothetical protein